MKRISTGHYRGAYKGIEFTVTKVEVAERAWYFQVGGSEDVNDWHSSKRAAILAAKEAIDASLIAIIST